MSFDVARLGTMVFELAPCAVAVIDRDYHVVAANGCVVADYGPWEERHCYEVFKRRHRPCAECAALQTFEDGQVHRTEERGLDKDGRQTHFVVKTAPLRGASGEIEYVVEMSLDISSYRQLESQHRLLFERVPCFVTVLDSDYRIVDANWRHQETFGDARGRHCYETYMKAERPCADCPTRRTFADGRVHTHQQQALDKKGQQVHFVVHSAPVYDEFGEIGHVIEMASDITPLVAAQRQLLLAEGESALRKAMGMLAESIEQLRAPLAHVAQQIRDGLAAADGARLAQSAAELQDRVDYLQALSTVLERERHAAATAREPLAPAALVARVVEAFAGRATSPRVAVQGAAAAGLAPIAGDRALLEACLSCLICDYIAFHVPRAARDAAHHVLLSASAAAAGVVFEVRYQGVRLAEDAPPDAAVVPGAGLSLAVVQRAIEACGGRIAFGSAPGQGIAVAVELPLAR